MMLELQACNAGLKWRCYELESPLRIATKSASFASFPRIDKRNKLYRSNFSVQAKCRIFESLKRAFQGGGFKWKETSSQPQDQALTALTAALRSLNRQGVQVHKDINVLYKLSFKVTEGTGPRAEKFVCQAIVWLENKRTHVLRTRIAKGDALDFIFQLVPQILAFGLRFFWHLKMNKLEVDLPSHVDWRENGAVTSVRDQGPHETCFAFSAVSSIEGICAIRFGNLYSLSPRYLVDRVPPSQANLGYGIHNNLLSAFQAALENGVPLEDDYPYVGYHKKCQDIDELFSVKIDGFVYLLPFDELALLTAVSKQPVSAGMLVDPSFANCDGEIYSGIPTDFRGVPTFHAVTIVGYTRVKSKACWIVKESSGKDNPTGGYVYVLRGTGDPLGVGGINIFAIYPVILKPQHHRVLRLFTRLASRCMPSLVWFIVGL